MFENFLDHCRAEWKSSPARAVAGESSAWSYCVPLLRAAPSYRRVTAGKIPGTGTGKPREKGDPGTGPHFGGSVKVNVRGTFQLPTSCAPIMKPSSMSVRRDMPLHITMLPGGESLARAR